MGAKVMYRPSDAPAAGEKIASLAKPGKTKKQRFP
jgi:hypothetical protein